MIYPADIGLLELVQFSSINRIPIFMFTETLHSICNMSLNL